MKLRNLVPVLLLMITIISCAELKEELSVASNQIQIVPKPNQLEIGEGSFSISKETTLIISNENRVIGSLLEEKLGFKLQTSKSDNNFIKFEINEDIIKNKEGYKLIITPKGIIILAATPRGLFYGLQTLFQILPSKIEDKNNKRISKWVIPTLEINDGPNFKWRGMHLDVGRHFFTVDFIKKQLEVMAMFKMNTFHWHLTEDQGWRIEIKKYPKLTSIGSKRLDEGKEYGGFYTQEQIKEVVNYAAELHIDVVPEIELPGHSLAALVAYPELGCTGGPYKVRNIWGVEPDIYCAGKEEVFLFIEDVLEEVISLFPYEYFHIGGDEAPKARWKTCANCQKRMSDEGLQNEHELQSYFIKRVEQVLQNHNKKMIGWDEILEGGLAESASVMSWRGENGGIEAANMGHDVVMTPGEFVYLDHYQGSSKVEPVAIGGYTTLEKTYSYNPIPKEIETSKAHHVLGTQGNLWTEYMYNENDMEYRAWPRLIALAEVGWTSTNKKNFNDFLIRMENQFSRLDYHQVNYHIPLPEGVPNHVAFIDSAKLAFSTTRPLAMYYTTDGSEPNLNSRKYTDTLLFTSSTIIKICTALKHGKMSPVRTITVEKQMPLKSVEAATSKTIKFKLKEGEFYDLNKINDSGKWIENEAKTLKEAINFGNIKEPSAKIFEGFLKVDETGVYEFSTNLNQLYIANKLLIDNSNDVKKYSRNDSEIALEKGLHPIKIIQLNNIEGGWPQLWNDGEIYYKTPSTNKLIPIPSEQFFSSK